MDMAVWLIDQDYECYYPDLPPFGREKPTLENYDADHYAEFVADYIKSNFDNLEKHSERRPVLIGYSMGSLVAAAVASRYPDLVSSKLILLAPISRKIPKRVIASQAFSAFLPNRLVDYATAKRLSVSKTQLKETLQAIQAYHDYHPSTKGIRLAGRFFTDYQISDFDFHKNTLLIAGDSDRLIPRRYTDVLVKNLQERFKRGNTPYSITSEYIAGGGHLLNYEHPKEVTKLIQEFLER